MSFLNLEKLLAWTNRTSSDSNSSDDINTIKDAIDELAGNSGSQPDKTVQENADDIAILQSNPSLPYDYIEGLEISNDTDTDHDINIEVGRCKDSTGAYDLILETEITKQIDAAWAAGDDAGGLDTGSVANDTWYYIWLIRKDSDGSIDALFSTSATSPTMPSGYTYKRRIRGAVLTDGSANILPFRQKDNNFSFIDFITDVNDTNVAASRTLATLSVPPNFIGIVHANYFYSATRYLIIQEVTATDYAPSTQANSSLVVTSSAQRVYLRLEILVDASSQVAYRADNTSSDLVLNTYGFIDPAQ